MWDSLGNTLNNAFFFVTDAVIALQGFFIEQALSIGRIVLLIAILSAALNYALTGQGLKENFIKILKASLFFLIVIALYPRIIGFITNWTFDMAEKSVGKAVGNYFDQRTRDITSRIVVYTQNSQDKITVTDPITGETYKESLFHSSQPSYSGRILSAVMKERLDKNNFFSKMAVERTSATSNNPRREMSYQMIAPAAVLQVIMLLASDCMGFADSNKKFGIPEFSKVLKGLICAFFLILTGVFALLEYITCFLEFMLVASVGVILFPLSIWEGSKFMSEKFIGAIVGFFMKLLFCNIAIFLLLYGFISLFYILQDAEGFQGHVSQILFIVFSCLLFFYICKSAPGIAQSLLTGVPSLSAAGAISAVGGAVAAAGATIGLAKSVGDKAGNAIAGGVAKAGVGAVGSLMEAGASAKAVAGMGGTRSQQTGAFFSSLKNDVGDTFKAGALGLTRNLLGGQGGAGGSGAGGTNPHSWRESFSNDRNADGTSKTFKQHFQDRQREGTKRAKSYAKKHGI